MTPWWTGELGVGARQGVCSREPAGEERRPPLRPPGACLPHQKGAGMMTSSPGDTVASTDCQMDCFAPLDTTTSDGL